MDYALNLHENDFKWKTMTWSIQPFQSYKKKSIAHNEKQDVIWVVCSTQPVGFRLEYK